MTETPLVLSFPDPRCRDVALSGGKGASLATMTGEGLPVPPGFVITSAAFAAAVDEDGLRARMRAGDVAGAPPRLLAASPPRRALPLPPPPLDPLGAAPALPPPHHPTRNHLPPAPAHP